MPSPVPYVLLRRDSSRTARGPMLMEVQKTRPPLWNLPWMEWEATLEVLFMTGMQANLWIWVPSPSLCYEVPSLSHLKNNSPKKQREGWAGSKSWLVSQVHTTGGRGGRVESKWSNGVIQAQLDRDSRPLWLEAPPVILDGSSFFFFLLSAFWCEEWFELSQCGCGYNPHSQAGSSNAVELHPKKPPAKEVFQVLLQQVFLSPSLFLGKSSNYLLSQINGIAHLSLFQRPPSPACISQFRFSKELTPLVEVWYSVSESVVVTIWFLWLYGLSE